MKNIKYVLSICICFFLFSFNVKSQQVNTLYFMDNVPVRHYLNPAFQPYSNFYLGIPVLGFTQFGVGNNSLALNDFVYNKNGQTISFLHPMGNKDDFYKALRPTTLIGSDIQLNLLDFGFRVKSTYWSFSLTEKFESKLSVPKDFMKLLLYGTPEIESNIYNLKKLSFNASAYTEAAFGFSKIMNDKLSIGGKLKLLYGNANVSMSNDDLKLNAGVDEWRLRGTGTMNYAGAVDLNGNSIQSFDPEMPESNNEFFKPAGFGAAIDLGATYKPLPNLTVSAAITDLGMIRWKKNAKSGGYNVNYAFVGVDSINFDSDFDSDFLSDSIFDDFKNSLNDTVTGGAYTTGTSPKLNVGVEYGFLENKLSVGLLSRTFFQNKVAYEELTASVNGRPVDWFNMSASYSFINGRMSSIGAGLGLRIGFVNCFFSADYIPLEYAPLDLNDLDSDLPESRLPIAYNTKGLNFAFGVNLVFGNRKDKDHDGVVDKKDLCPETPLEVIVDMKGCPVDTDGDGVPDYIDKCSQTPPEAYNSIDQDGCPLDTDGDGIVDYLDACPDTPAAAIGFVDDKGCELDTDSDGVSDYLDKCPDSPEGIKVDSVGCTLDTDGDGVLDDLDLCPNTPGEAILFVDQNGCPLDTDDDGVPDYLDKCPDTPIEARGMVDQNGCPRDTDNDSIFDYLDNCPKIPGVISNHGCPEIKKEVRRLFEKAMRGIQFASGKDQIRSGSYPILNQIAGVLIENPTYLVEVKGHTDNVGKAEMNQKLSESRALAVRNYLIGKGIAENRMTSNGYGDTLPITTNETAAGRSLNRRVEFVITFEEISFE